MGCDLVNVEGTTAQGNTHNSFKTMFTLPEIATPSQNFINLPAILNPSSSTPWRDTYSGTDQAEQFYVQPPVRNSKFDRPDKTARVNAGGGDDIIEGSDSRNGDVLFGQRGDDLIQGHGGNDVIDGGAGSDRISGGRGADIVWMSGGFDVFRDFNGQERDRISLHRAKGKVYLTEIGDDTYITPENFDGVMRVEGGNGSEVYNAVMGVATDQLVAVNFSPALLLD